MVTSVVNMSVPPGTDAPVLPKCCGFEFTADESWRARDVWSLDTVTAGDGEWILEGSR